MLRDSEDTARIQLCDGPTNGEARRAAGQGPRTEAALTVLRGPNAGAIFTLDAPRLLIGRSGDVAILLSDRGLSRRHACIERRAGNYFIEDLGSTNGTFVGGMRIQGRHQLQDGARIQLGEHTLLRFALHDALEQEAARRMHDLMVRDPLTRVFNRRHLEERLAAEVAYCERHRSRLALLLVDLDDFKAVNDSFGHDVGDMVLRVLARSLTRMSRAEDLVARYGGEEFVILARGIDEAGAVIFAQRLRSGIERLRVPIPGGQLQVTVSIGLTHIEGCERVEAGDLLRQADQAMYRAKDVGKNSVELTAARPSETRSLLVVADAAERLPAARKP